MLAHVHADCVTRRLILLYGLVACLVEQDFQIPSCLQAEQLEKKTPFACKQHRPGVKSGRRQMWDTTVLFIKSLFRAHLRFKIWVETSF